MKISCNIAKDLMIPYLDGICSDESVKLVDEHIRECSECREYLENISSDEREKETLELQKIRKMNLIMKIRLIMIFVVPFVLSVLIYWETRDRFFGNGILPVQIFYFISMPVLMISFTAAFSETQKINSAKCVVPAVISTAAVIFAGVTVTALLVSPLSFTSEFINTGFKSVILIEIISLAVYAFSEKTKKSFLFQSVSWLGIYFAATVISVLSFMSDMRTLRFRIISGFVALTLEFLVINLTAKIREKNVQNR